MREHPPETPAPSRIPELPNPSLDLEYPRAPNPVNKLSSAMPIILSTVVLLVGMLIFLTHLPLDVPPIDRLTVYTCDPLPPLPSLGSRQSYPLHLRCSAAGQVIYQSSNTIPPYQATTNPCIKQLGQTQIWRTTPPSRYGSYIFQVACDGHIVTDYKSRAANYKTIQQFVFLVSALITLAGLIGLAVSVLRSLKRAGE